MSLFNELKRRNVFRVSAAYAVVAWLLLQAADILLENFGAPEWVFKSFVVLLVLGLPVAVFLAWAFELTPEGIKTDAAARTMADGAEESNKAIDRVIVIGLLVVIAVLVVERFWSSAPEAVVTAGPTVVAVLPFANLSDDADNEYFADGVAEEVLNLLARSGDLRVISRSSSFSFKGRSVSIPEVAARLGASHILEGSIRRAGDRIRVTAQLIDAGTDIHLWSETYDRQLVDVFSVQDEIARAIAGALKVNLLAAGDRTVAIDVYDKILQARAISSRRGDEAGLRRAVALLQEATREAPDSAEAWGQLALAQMVLTNWFDANGEALARVEHYARAALARDETNVSALTALGAWYLFNLEFEASEANFRRALAINPNSVDAANWFGDFLLVTYRLDEALVWDGLAAELDPLVAVHQLNLGMIHSASGNVDAAIAAYHHAMQLDPGFRAALGHLTLLLFSERRFGELRAFAESYRGPLRAELDEIVVLARLVESGNLDGAEAWVEAETAPNSLDRASALRMVYRDESPEAWAIVADFMLARADAGYPSYVWPNLAPTDPDILAQSEVYAAFWRMPPRDRILRVRGHWTRESDD